MSRTGIQWTEFTLNVTTGCTKISQGCKFCYAEREAQNGMGQFAKNPMRKFTDIKLHDDQIGIPVKRKAPAMYFVDSMSDLFHEEIPFSYIDKVFGMMMSVPRHTFQVLTKRPARMKLYMDTSASKTYEVWGELAAPFTGGYPLPTDEWPPKNVWMGTSIEDQETLDERLPLLLQTRAALKWVSFEPLLGPVSGFGSGIDWAVVGGESGWTPRPMNLQWARDILQTCRMNTVPFFMKQIGGLPRAKKGNMEDFPEDLRVREWPSK